MRLMVVDDEPEVGHLVVQTAEALGFSATMALDARELDPGALATLDLLLLDLMMPSLDGIEVLRDIARGSAHPDIVLMSGLDRRTLDGARRLAHTSGLRVLGILQKPFRPVELRDILSRYASERPRDAAAPHREALAPRVAASELEGALQRGEIVPYFQPQVSLTDGGFAGVEALARWQHPAHGLLPPQAFIAHAESQALALPFAKAFLGAALREVTQVSRDCGFDGSLSVNVSPTALSDLAFPEQVLASIAASGLDRARVILEVTETSVAASEAVALDIQTRLRMRGVRLSIDDFGTGQSSLERLHDAPFDELKIDRVFVSGADSDPAARSIVENSIQLGHSLGMKVVAEGVETAATFHWLRSLGCDLAQGYWIARPLRAADVGAWAEAWARQHAAGLRTAV